MDEPTYGRAVEGPTQRSPGCLGRRPGYGAGDYSVIVTADHGGHDVDHGRTSPRDVTIPWVAWGRAYGRARSTACAWRTLRYRADGAVDAGRTRRLRLGRLTGARRVSVRPARASKMLQSKGVVSQLA